MFASLFTWVDAHLVQVQVFFVCSYIFAAQHIVRKIKNEIVRGVLSPAFALVLSVLVVFEILGFGRPIFYFVIAGVVYLSVLPIAIEVNLMHELFTAFPERVARKIRMKLHGY